MGAALSNSENGRRRVGHCMQSYGQMPCLCKSHPQSLALTLATAHARCAALALTSHAIGLQKFAVTARGRPCARAYRYGPVGYLARYRKHSNNYMRCWGLHDVVAPRQASNCAAHQLFIHSNPERPRFYASFYYSVMSFTCYPEGFCEWILQHHITPPFFNGFYDFSIINATFMI